MRLITTLAISLALLSGSLASDTSCPTEGDALVQKGQVTLKIDEKDLEKAPDEAIARALVADDATPQDIVNAFLKAVKSIDDSHAETITEAKVSEILANATQAALGFSEIESSGKEGKANPYLVIRGFTKLEVPRSEVNDFTEQYLFKWKFKENGWKYQDGRFFVQTGFNQGTFVVKGADGEFDFGLVRAAWMPNPVSLLTQYAHYGLIEKMHVVSSTRPLDTTSRDRAERNFNPISAILARKFARLHRMITVSALLSTDVGAQFAKTMVPRKEVAVIRSFAADGKAPPASWKKRATFLREKMQRETQKARENGGLPPKSLFRSYIGCMHYEKGERTTVDGKPGIWLPLDTKLMVFRGGAILGPWRSSEVGFGTGVFKKSGDYIEMFIGMASSCGVGDAQLLQDPNRKQIVGPADGEGNVPIAPMTFVPPKLDPVKQVLGFTMTALLGLIPNDYGMLSKKREAEACPKAEFDRQSKMFAETDFLPLQNPETASRELKIAFLNAATNVGDCAIDWAKPDGEPKTDFDLVEAILFVHAMRETPGSSVNSFLFSRTWQTLSEELV